MEAITYTRNEYAAQLLAGHYARTPRAFVRSFGCQQNVNDGERLKGVLFDMGFALEEVAENADLIIFNTCAVREHAEQRAFGNIGALKSLKETKPGLVLALCGCMGEKPDTVEKIKKSYPYIDIVFGTGSADLLPDLLAEKLAKRKRIFPAGTPRRDIVENLPVRREPGVKAFLPIMYGCDNFCSYCIVPYVRGRERSRRPEDIKQEFESLVNEGYKEITLLGQNVNSYGKGLPSALDFSDLLSMLCETPGEYKLRFMTSHPKDATRKLIDTMLAHPQICRHLHLPVQSGSDTILAAMNRGYTAESYLELLNYAKAACPEMTYSSDIIVGFPGETEADFEKTVRLVQQAGYTQLFTFIYSKRSGTAAAKLEDDTPHKVKAGRIARLLEIQEQSVQALSAGWIGKTFTALAEGPGRKAGTLAARLDNNVLVEFAAPESLIGRFVPVRVTALRGAILQGEAID